MTSASRYNALFNKMMRLKKEMPIDKRDIGFSWVAYESLNDNRTENVAIYPEHVMYY